MRVEQLSLLLVLCAVATAAYARPDSDVPPLPGPGLSYGGIPYGSMSGNVAEFFRRQAPSVGGRAQIAPYPNNDVDFAPIEQWL